MTRGASGRFLDRPQAGVRSNPRAFAPRAGMKPPLYRTHASSLTDDELILFDVLFQYFAAADCLRRINFSECFNTSPHGLDDNQLGDTLSRFCEAGLLQAKTIGEPCYGLTPRGGEIWEAERTPAWERYATERYGVTSGGRALISICAVSPDVRDDFWRVGCESHFWQARRPRVRSFRITNHVLIPWKTFPAVHVAVGVVDDESAGVPAEEYVSCDWSSWESRRTWWRCVAELQKFVGGGRGGRP